MNADRFDLVTVAGRARGRLDPVSAGEIAAFVRAAWCADGGFRSRGGASDLYYTVFGMSALRALDAELSTEQVRPYLATFGDGEDLDFVHLVCLARCRAMQGRSGLWRSVARPALKRLETWRSADGGYHHRLQHAPQGTAYGCLLAALAYGESGAIMPAPRTIARCLDGLRRADGSWANDQDAIDGTTTATAAAVVVLTVLDALAEERTSASWLRDRLAPSGGFVASPATPAADLLSTATALHALRVLGSPLESLRDACSAFVEGLWDESGGFRGHALDPIADCEYTFYALLALGCLA